MLALRHIHYDEGVPLGQAGRAGLMLVSRPMDAGLPMPTRLMCGDHEFWVLFW